MMQCAETQQPRVASSHRGDFWFLLRRRRLLYGQRLAPVVLHALRCALHVYLIIFMFIRGFVLFKGKVNGMNVNRIKLNKFTAEMNFEAFSNNKNPHENWAKETDQSLMHRAVAKKIIHLIYLFILIQTSTAQCWFGHVVSVHNFFGWLFGCWFSS